MKETVSKRSNPFKGLTRKEISEKSACLRKSAIQMFEQGMSNKDISEKLGLSCKTIEKWRIYVWDQAIPFEQEKKIGSDAYVLNFKREWARAVNPFRKYYGLPLLSED